MLVLIAQAVGPVDQGYLLEARQMQALSFTVRIPLVCFGVAFPDGGVGLAVGVVLLLAAVAGGASFVVPQVALRGDADGR